METSLKSLIDPDKSFLNSPVSDEQVNGFRLRREVRENNEKVQRELERHPTQRHLRKKRPENPRGKFIVDSGSLLTYLARRFATVPTFIKNLETWKN